MSMWVHCPQCGELKEVPAFDGDGVFTTHRCPPPEVPAPTTRRSTYDKEDEE